MGMDAALSGVSTIGNLVGGGKASSAQQSAQNQSNQQQQQVMSMIKNFQSMATPVISSLVTSLQNWSGLKPQEMSALTTNAANSGMSDIRTAQSQGAYGANQNATIQNALRANQQSAQTAATNVGAQAATQELSALQSIPGALNTLNPVSGGANTVAGLSSQNQSTAAGYGNPFAPATNSVGQLLGSLQSSPGNTPVQQATGGSGDYTGSNSAPGSAGSW